MHRADLAAAVRAALESSCPGSRTELLGSLAHGTADAYSDIDLRWVVPDEAFPGCLEPGLTALGEVQPVEMVRFDPDKVTPLKDEAASKAYLAKPARSR